MSQDLLRAVRTAMRTQLRTITRIQTTATIQVVADGYVRTDGGSFITDDWCANDEVTASGFPDAANLLPRQVEEVTASKLTVFTRTPLVPAAAVAATLYAKVPQYGALQLRAQDPPSDGRPWWKEDLIPAGSTAMSIGPKKRIENRGIYQIKLMYPTDYGTSAIEAMAAAIVDGFYPGLVLTARGRTVNITSAYPSQATPEADFSALPISIGYKVFTITPQ